MRKLLLLLVFISGYAQAQIEPWNIVLQDARSAETIPFVTIIINGQHQFQTNIDGVVEFEQIPVERVEHISIEAFGYEKVELTELPTSSIENGRPVYVIELNPDLGIIDPQIRYIGPVTINALRTDGKPEESTVSVDVLEPYLITERAQSKIQRTFQQAPGVHVADGSVNIRSGSGWSYGAGSRVLVMLDGMPLISPDAGQAQWSLIPTEAVQNMEIVKGAGSALYGTSAMNGIINVNTLAPTMEPRTDIRMYQGLYDAPAREELKWWDGIRGWTGLQFNHTQSSGANNNLGWVIAGQAEYDAGYQYDVPDHRGRLFGKLTYYNPDNLDWRYDLAMTGLWSETGDALLWNGYNEAYIPLDSQATQTTGFDFIVDPKVRYYGGVGVHTLQGRLMVINNNARSESTDYYNASQLGFVEYNWQEYFDKLVITAGVSGQFGVSNSEVFEGRHDINSQAAFIQTEYRLPYIKFLAGVRYESLQLDNTRWSRPVLRFGVNGGTEATRFRASYGEGFRFPTMAESFTRTNVGALQVYPNQGLQPESGWSSEIGVRQLFRVSSVQGFVDVAGFWMRYNNMMEFSFGQWGTSGTGLENFGFRSINIGSTEIPGIESSIGFDIDISSKAKIKWMGGVTWMEPRPVDPDYVYETYPPVFPWQPDVELSYTTTSSNPESGILKYRYQWLFKSDIQFDYGRFSIGTSLRYNDYMQNVDGIFLDPLFSQFIPGVEESRANNVSGDFLVDVRFKYLVDENMSISFIVNNLTNLEYYVRPALAGQMRSFVLQLRYSL